MHVGDQLLRCWSMLDHDDLTLLPVPSLSLTLKRITNIIASFAIVNLFITPLCLINIRTYTHKIRLPL